MFRGMSAPEVWIESKRVVLSRGRLGGFLGEAAIIAAALLLGAFLPGWLGLDFSGAVLAGVVGAPIATMTALARRRIIAQGAGSIGVVDGDLVLTQGREKKQIPLADLASGRSSPRRGEVDFELRNGGHVVAAIANPADAERLLAAAGLDASKRTMRFELGENTFLTWMTFLCGPSVVAPVTVVLADLTPFPWIAGMVLFPLLFVLLFYLVRAAWGAAKFIVGADGIVINRAFGDEFVPYARVASIAMSHDHVSLRLDNGKRVRARARHLDDVQQGELKARIDAAIQAFQRGENAAESLSQLDRAGRPIAAWRTALGGLLEQQASYRASPLTRDQLLAVLESAAAPAERRLAAAVSLSASGDAEVATKIRIAAEACARPRVRIALSGLAEGEIDDAAIEAALAEDEPPQVANP